MDLISKIEALSKKQGLSRYRIAKNTGLAESTIKRIFEKKFSPKLEIVEKMADVVGAELQLKIKGKSK